MLYRIKGRSMISRDGLRRGISSLTLRSNKRVRVSMCGEVCEFITLFLPFHSYPTGKCWNSLHFTSLTHFIPIGDLDTVRRVPHEDGLATCVRVPAEIPAGLHLVSTALEPVGTHQRPGGRLAPIIPYRSHGSHRSHLGRTTYIP